MSPWSEAEQPGGPLPEQLEELKLAKCQAEAASEAKSRFLAQMSHEIRTPLTAMLGYAEFISDRDLSEADRRMAMDALRNNGQYLLKILNDILDLSQVEAGRLAVERMPCRTREIIREVVRLMKPRSEQKGLPLIVESHPGLPAIIQTDPTRLRQILTNLISNAIKFTTRGSIRFVARPLGDGSLPEFLQFEVIDSGIGLSESQQQRLFQSYSQAEESTHRRFGGNGLGLAISRQLAEMLGGSIFCSSSLGQGSMFTVTIATGLSQSSGLELGISSPAPNQELTPPRLVPQIPSMVLSPGGLTDDDTETVRSPSILVAEDYADNRRLIVHLLKKSGAQVDEAENGKIAVEKVMEAAKENSPYDLILMDMQMPEMDGFAATRLLRSQGYLGPVVALTANSMKGDRENCLAAGCDDYISKPLNPADFWPVITRHLMSCDLPPDAVPVISTPVFPPPR